MSIQQSMTMKLPLPPKPGTSRGNVVQVISKTNSIGAGNLGQSVIQQRPHAFKPIQIRPNVPSSAQLFLNTNTALQYTTPVKRKLEIGDHGNYSKMNTPQMLVSGVNTSNIGMSLNLNQQVNSTNVITAGLNSVSNNNSRKPCNCTKSHCLKLYCECFAQGQLCQNCNCNNCMNNLTYEDERARAIKMTLDRNPMAFHPKIGRGEGERKHTKGCNCKRSGCLKNYCECYEAKISCSDLCRCQGCRNTEDSIERRSLMRLAAMGSLKTKQPNALKKHLVSHPADTLPHVFITWEVAEATCGCMLAQADDAERRDIMPAAQERIILEEFGRCLSQIIESASKALPCGTGGGHLGGGGSGESLGGEPGGGSGVSSGAENDDHSMSHHHSHHHMGGHHMGSRQTQDLGGVVVNV